MMYTYFFKTSKKEYKIKMDSEYMIPRTEKGVEYDVLHTPWKYYADNTAGFTKMRFTAGYMKISAWSHPFNPMYYARFSLEGFPATV